uniref:Uncharacterized protein n=1 Tax=Tetradesmus obliquus TaxID=3088 RepID=A0A383VY16_TETOB|eukprot:jgi/Sobl393_1/11926/SZX70101.1
MSMEERSSVAAAWRRISDTLQPLATAAAAAAGSESIGSSSSLSLEQHTSLQQVAKDVEQALGRTSRLPPSALSYGAPQLLFRTAAALLDLMARQQQTQQQQQQQQQSEAHHALTACTEAMLSAATAMLREPDTATKLQLLGTTITSGLMDCAAAAMHTTTAALQAADAAAAAALAAGNGLPMQYRQQQRTVPAAVRLAIALIRLFDQHVSWPGPVLLLP